MRQDKLIIPLIFLIDSNCCIYMTFLMMKYLYDIFDDDVFTANKCKKIDLFIWSLNLTP